MNLPRHPTGAEGRHDIDGHATSLGVVTARPGLGFVACCPDCGDPVPADQVKCPVCALL
jgi:hypothetical protein